MRVNLISLCCCAKRLDARTLAAAMRLARALMSSTRACQASETGRRSESLETQSQEVGG